jgi:hypothetical protein
MCDHHNSGNANKLTCMTHYVFNMSGMICLICLKPVFSCDVKKFSSENMCLLSWDLPGLRGIENFGRFQLLKLKN